MSDEKKAWPGPPAGVSTTDGKGGHQQVAGPRRGRRRQVGEDILQNVNELKVVKDDGGLTPAGTRGIKKDIRIGVMPKTRRARRHHVTFRSVDEKDYVFRTHDTKGKSLDYISTQVLYIALRELSLGGSALPILKAFNVNFNDEEGKVFLPVADELLNRMYDDDDDADVDGPTHALGQAE